VFALRLLICLSSVPGDFKAGERVESILVTLVLFSISCGWWQSHVPADRLTAGSCGGRPKMAAISRPRLVPITVVLATASVFAELMDVQHFRVILNTQVVGRQVRCASVSTF
jgi:hypothetical protein